MNDVAQPNELNTLTTRKVVDNKCYGKEEQTEIKQFVKPGIVVILNDLKGHGN